MPAGRTAQKPAASTPCSPLHSPPSTTPRPSPAFTTCSRSPHSRPPTRRPSASATDLRRRHR
eukprot:5286856-Pleurochrysis_carterae.AAC.1